MLAACLGSALLVGCAAPQPAATGLPELTRAYQTATSHGTRAVRGPARERRGLALRRIERGAGDLLQQSSDWTSDTRLVSVRDPERPVIRATVGEFRTALESLRAAARRGDLASVRTDYASALAAYRRLPRGVPAAE